MKSSRFHPGGFGLTGAATVAVVSVLAFALLLFSGIAQPTRAQAATRTALLHGDSVVNTIGTGSCPAAPAAPAMSQEECIATTLGYTVTVVSDATWGGMSAAAFGAYDLLMVGDPSCGYVRPGIASNAANLGAAVMGTGGGRTAPGNRIVVGTDPVYHDSSDMFTPGGRGTVIREGIAYAGLQVGRTGFYYTASCSANYGFSADILTTLAAVSAGTGTWTINSGPPCGGNVAVIASNPAFATLSTASLAGWGCSVHSSHPTFPSDWAALAVATDTPSLPTCGIDPANPGAGSQCGEAYILVAGSGIVLTSGSISLTPLEATNPVGTTHTVTAHVSSGGSPLVGQVVTFSITGVNAGAVGTCVPVGCVSDASGDVTFTYTGAAGVGDDTIKAQFTDEGHSLQSATALKHWIIPFTSAITLTPPTATNVLPSSHTVTATVTEMGSPVSGRLVTFAVTGTNAGAVGVCAPVTCLSDASGVVTFTYAGTVAGSDTIAASFTDTDTPPAVKTATATKTWTAAPPTTICTIDRADDDDHDGHGSAATAVTSHSSGPRWVNDTCVITLTPGSATNVLPSSHTVTATVKEGGVGVAGRVVTFKVLSGPNAGLTGTGTTGLDGTVAWTYAGTTKGKDVIRASYVDGAGDVELSAKVTKTWVNPPSCRDDKRNDDNIDREGGHASGSAATAVASGEGGDRVESSRGVCYITLNPTSATNVLPSSHTLTAKVMEFGLPVAGKTVTFTVLTGPNAGLTGTGVTDASGIATWTYAGTTAGKDTIQAKYTNSAGDIEFSDKVFKTWTKPTPPRRGGDRD